MAHSAVPSGPAAEIESSLLGVLLSADSAREGAAGLLESLASVLEECPAAIALRDRDALSLHILAEVGAPHDWPSRLEPQLVLGGRPGVDAESGAMVLPLRANGRVIGALLIGDAHRTAALAQSPDLAPLLDTAASVLSALAARAETEVRRHAWARHAEAIVSGMAHQITNPLSGATAIAEILAEELEDAGQRAAVRQIRQELARAFAVLRDLLEFQRDTHAHDGVLDLNVIVERILRFRSYAIREQGIAVGVRPFPGFLPVRVDSRGLQHAILAALRFAELQSHGTVNRRIDVAVTERGATEVAVEITDSGTGTIPEVAPSYFDLPLLRGDALFRNDGLERPDLGLVDSLLRGFGGQLLATGSKTDGTTLVLVLPRASTPARSRSPGPPPPPPLRKQE